MKARIFHLLLHPLFISLLLGTGVCWLLPSYQNKFYLTLLTEEYAEVASRLYYEDLDGDGTSEKIIFRPNIIGDASYMIMNSKGQLIDQWNFNSHFPNESKQLSFIDIDQDGFLEIANLTRKNDTAYLNIVEPMDSLGIEQLNIPIDRVQAYNGSYTLIDAFFHALPNGPDKLADIVFMLNVGFTGNPRKVYRYNLANRTFQKSPHLTNVGQVIDIIDITGDGRPEILTRTLSSGNEIDSLLTIRSDYSTWLTVLTEDLEFLFDPIEIKSPYSSIQAVYPINGNLLCLYNTKSPGDKPHMILVNAQGKVLLEREMESQTFFSSYSKEGILFKYDRESGKTEVYNDSLTLIKTSQLPPRLRLQSVDITHNGAMEWLAYGELEQSFSVWDPEFRNVVSLPIQASPELNTYFGIRFIKKGEPIIWIKNGKKEYNLTYGLNATYYLKYLIYLGVFVGTYLMVFFVMKLQSLREKHQRQIETQIAELQLKTIKNQVDPHFVFNSINAIGEMALTENKLDADRFITSFARLMRRMLSSSDRVSQTLQEEIDIVTNYVQLQEIRLNRKIALSLEMDQALDLNLEVPKHVFYNYVENSIKHGMSHKGLKLRIVLGARRVRDGLLLYVEDNAGGIGASTLPRSQGTGNGMKIQEQIFDLYQRLKGTRISYRYHNLAAGQGGQAGLRVEIILSKK